MFWLQNSTKNNIESHQNFTGLCKKNVEELDKQFKEYQKVER